MKRQMPQDPRQSHCSLGPHLQQHLQETLVLKEGGKKKKPNKKPPHHKTKQTPKTPHPVAEPHRFPPPFHSRQRGAAHAHGEPAELSEATKDEN